MPQYTPVYSVMDVLLLEVPDEGAQHSGTSFLLVGEVGLMTTMPDLEGVGSDPCVGLSCLGVLIGVRVVTGVGHSGFVPDLVNSALAWKWTLCLVSAITSVLLCLLGLGDLVVVL